METSDKLMIVWLIVATSVVSSYFTYHLATGEAREIMKGLHCAKIVKASTMEEAIKQIEINQAISGG